MGLVSRFNLENTMFKKYPSCGGTQGSTEVILALIKEHNLSHEEIASVDVFITPSTYRLVGKQFDIGDNPKVSAQFNIQYCVANGLLRKCCRLEHFNETSIKAPEIMEITKKIHVFADAALVRKGSML